MKIKIQSFLIISMMSLTLFSCSDTSSGSFTMIMSGSVHGQLDPCG
ncbi:hypothetical protein OAC91_00805 [Candidatus Marinimicrobia bacterium]|nr:hypothetical protein [Candidatus Neomarinimicrobiota bacterium]